MSTERDYHQLETEFNKANGIVSCIGDLLMISHGTTMPLADGTLENIGYTCFEEADKMKSLFSELLKLYTKKK